MKKRNKKKNHSLIQNIIFSFIALFGLTVAAVFLILNRNLEKDIEKKEAELTGVIDEYKAQYPYSQSDYDEAVTGNRNLGIGEGKENLRMQIKGSLDNGETIISVLRNLFPEYIISYKNKYNFYPIDYNQKMDKYKRSNFLIERENSGNAGSEDDNQDGADADDKNKGDVTEIKYVDDSGVVVSAKGIDVSSHQGKIDWEKVKADGVDFAFLRLGGRGTTEGAIYLDQTFIYNVENATKNGIKVGVYFYTQATSAEEAIEEAEFVIENIEPYDITYPVAYDIENTNDRTKKLNKENYTECTRAFVDTIAKAGYRPMIYGNLNSMVEIIDQSQFEDIDKWFAQYNDDYYYPYEIAIWQYSSKGRVDGINGLVDLNIGLKHYDG